MATTTSTCRDRSTAQTVLDKMFNNSIFSDMTFSVNSTKFYAGRAHMIASSDVFQALLSADFKEGKETDIVIHIMYEDSFYQLLRHLYGKNIDFQSLKVDVVCEILKIADYYNIPKLVDFTKEFLYSLKNMDSCL